MRRLHRHTPLPRSGFTLMEILVIAAIIALLSSMAIISARVLIVQSKRKSSFADAKALGDSVAMAHFNLGFFPKFSYLAMNRAILESKAGALLLPPDIDAYGHPVASRARAILNNWQGPYLQINPSRKAASPSSRSPGYLVTMIMPTTNEEMNWPADPWGNPYVPYLVGVRRVDDRDEVGFIASATQDPDYHAVIISYGQNGVPGGPSIDATEAEVMALRQWQDEAERNHRLYHDDPAGREGYFLALTPDEFNTDRLVALSADLGALAGQPYLNGAIPAIMDKGSDDIIIPIP